MTELKDIKFKTGNLDKDGFMHVKAETDGSSGGADVHDFEMSIDFFGRYNASATTREAITITNEEDLQLLTDINEVLKQNQNAIIRVKIMGTLSVYPIINYASDLRKVAAIQSQVFLDDTTLLVVTINLKDDNTSYAVMISYYNLDSLLPTP